MEMGSWIDRLGWTLLHALWQGAAVWVALQLVLAAMRRSTAQARYVAACAALAAMVLLPWMTYFSQDLSDRIASEQHQLRSARGGSAGADSKSASTSALASASASASASARAGRIAMLTAQSVRRTLTSREQAALDTEGSIGSDDAPAFPSPGSGGAGTARYLYGVTPLFPASSAISAAIQSALPWLVGVWWCGVVIFALRLCIGWRQVERMARGSLLPLDAEWKSRWEKLLRRAGITPQRRVRMGETASVLVPMVAGWLKPAVLLPLGALTSLPVEQVEAILLHELAHIRRHDFAVNLLQSVAETLFFYHPAVWSVSHRIRQERELACDDLAVMWCEDRLGYAEALAAFEGLRAAPALSLGLSLGLAATGSGSGGGRNSGSTAESDLLTRVKRIVLGVEPRYPWPTSRVLSLGGLLAVAAYIVSVVLAPALASNWVMAEERIKAVEAAKAKSASDLDADSDITTSPERLAGKEAPEVRIFGTIRTEDGGPLPRDVSISAISTSAHSTHNASVGTWSETGTWSYTIQAGKMFAYATATGYAPLVTGVLPSSKDGKCGPVDLVLKKGFPAKFRFLSPEGTPLPGVEITGILRVNAKSGSYIINKLKTDAAGEISIGNVEANTPLSFTADKPPYQSARRDINAWTEGRLVEWKLERAVPATGTVTDASTGKPIAGAKISLAQKSGDTNKDNMSYSVGYTSILGTSDAQGRFVLDSLNSRYSYNVFVEAPGYAIGVYPIRSGTTDAVLALQPGLHIKGKIVDPNGLLKSLPHKRKEEAPLMRADIELHITESFTHGHLVEAKVQEVDGVMSFEFKDLPKGPTGVQLNGVCDDPAAIRSYKLDLQGNIDDYTFVVEAAPKPGEPGAESRYVSPSDYGKPTSTQTLRTVQVKLDAGRSGPPPTGFLKVEFNRDTDASSHVRDTQKVPVSNGVATFQVPVPNELKLYANHLTGYWFKTQELKVPGMSGQQNKAAAPTKEQEPFLATVPVIPAGAIHGNITSDPELAGTTYFTSVVVVEPPPGLDLKSLETGSGTTSDSPNYTVSPLPLGGTYAVVLWNPPYFSYSQPVKVDAGNPVVDLPIRRPAGKELRGILVDKDGKPLALKKIGFSYTYGKHSSYSTDLGMTGNDGTFVIPNVNFDVPGYYQLQLPFQSWRRNDVRITRDTPQPVVIRCEERKED